MARILFALMAFAALPSLALAEDWKVIRAEGSITDAVRTKILAPAKTVQRLSAVIGSPK